MMQYNFQLSRPKQQRIFPINPFRLIKKQPFPSISLIPTFTLPYEPHSLQIFKEGNDLTEKEVFEFLNHFAVKEGNRVSILKVFPAGKLATLLRTIK